MQPFSCQHREQHISNYEITGDSYFQIISTKMALEYFIYLVFGIEVG
jgi:hypothetical protein